jgi:colanic acid/amylovoran biosynthesis protein
MAIRDIQQAGVESIDAARPACAAVRQRGSAALGGPAAWVGVRRCRRPIVTAAKRAREARRLPVDTGGTYLVEQYPLWARLFEFRIAEALGIPVVFFTQSLGPFRRSVHRRALRRAFSRSPLVLLRDDRSLAHVQELGVPDRALTVTSDAVFALAPKAPVFARRPTRPRPRVAISVRAWPPHAPLDGPEVTRFTESITSVVTSLVETHGAEVLFVSTCQGIEEYWTNDSQVALRMADALSGAVRSHVIVDEAYHAPRELISLLATCDVVLATRMHAAILALCAQTPVVPIVYEFKTRELFARMGLEALATDIEAADPARLTALVAEMLTPKSKELRATFAEGVARERAQAEDVRVLLQDAWAARRVKSVEVV